MSRDLLEAAARGPNARQYLKMQAQAGGTERPGDPYRTGSSRQQQATQPESQPEPVPELGAAVYGMPSAWPAQAHQLGGALGAGLMLGHADWIDSYIREVVADA